MNQVMQGQPMTIFGDGLQTRAFSHVDDVAPVIARAPFVNASYQQVCNVGADRPYTVLDLAHEVAAAFGVDPQIRHLPARNEVTHAFSTHAKVRALFGDGPQIDLKTGIRRMAAWAKARGPMAPVNFKNIEIERNLPVSWRPQK